MNPETKTKIKLYLMWSYVLVPFTLIVLGAGIYYTNKFFQTHYFAFHSPVTVGLHSPVTIEKRSSVISFVEVKTNTTDIDPLTPDQRYGCNKFGDECKTFLAIFRAESSMNKKAINVNTDGTVDFGCMQINSIHLKKIDTDKINLFNCRDNIDVAYTIFKSWGNWKAWSAYNNGSYKKYLIN